MMTLSLIDVRDRDGTSKEQNDTDDDY